MRGNPLHRCHTHRKSGRSDDAGEGYPCVRRSHTGRRHAARPRAPLPHRREGPAGVAPRSQRGRPGRAGAALVVTRRRCGSGVRRGHAAALGPGRACAPRRGRRRAPGRAASGAVRHTRGTGGVGTTLCPVHLWLDSRRARRGRGPERWSGSSTHEKRRFSSRRRGGWFSCSKSWPGWSKGPAGEGVDRGPGRPAASRSAAR